MVPLQSAITTFIYFKPSSTIQRATSSLVNPRLKVILPGKVGRFYNRAFRPRNTNYQSNFTITVNYQVVNVYFRPAPTLFYTLFSFLDCLRLSQHTGLSNGYFYTTALVF